MVNCALDPATLARSIPGLTWVAFKVGGTDVAPDSETAHCRDVWRSMGLQVGAWVDCRNEPAVDVATLAKWQPLSLVQYDVEVAYKSDEGGHYEWAAQLVAEHQRQLPGVPAAVNSYGGYKTSIDFATFAEQRWPIFAQGYDPFTPADAWSYEAVYPRAGIHQLIRSRQLTAGQAVFRPEGL